MIEEPARLIGVLNVLSIEPQGADEDAIAFLKTVANELAMGVEFARLRNQTDTRLRRKSPSSARCNEYHARSHLR